MDKRTLEHWMPVPAYRGEYEVSSLGRVRSLDRVIVKSDGKPQTCHGKVLTPRPAPPDGYMIVTMAGATKRVHRLVAEAFCVGQGPGREVCHNDGDVRNNRADNLRWDTHSENMRDVVRHKHHHNASKTRCLRGHEFSVENTQIDHKGGRCCLLCRQIRELRRSRRARLTV